MFRTVKILLVGKDQFDFSFIKENLKSVSPNPVEFEKVYSVQELEEKTESHYHMVICEIDSSEELLNYLCHKFKRSIKIFLCKEEDVSKGFELFKKGAFDVLFYKNGVVPSERLTRAISIAVEVRELDWNSNFFHSFSSSSYSTPFYILNNEGTIEYVNSCYELMTGYSSNEVIGSNYRDIFVGQDKYMIDFFKNKLDECKSQKKEIAFEMKKFKKNGEEIWTSNVIIPFEFENQDVKHILCLEKNVTVEKISQSKLINSVDENGILFKDNPMPMLIFDLENLHIITVNDAMMPLYGYTKEEFTGMSIQNLHLEDDFVKLDQEMCVARMGMDQKSSWSHVTKTGELLNVEVFGKTVNFLGADKRMALINDVSGELQCKNTLKETQEKYKNIIENASDFIFLTDIEGCFSYLNPKLLEVMGFDENELMGVCFIKLIDPEHRREVSRFYLNQLDKEIQFSYYEFPVLTKTGNRIWIGQNVSPQFENGLLNGFQGMSRIITAKKENEKTLFYKNGNKKIGDPKQLMSELKPYLESILNAGEVLGQKSQRLEGSLKEIRDSAEDLMSVWEKYNRNDNREVLDEEIFQIDFDIQEELQHLIKQKEVKANIQNTSIVFEMEEKMPDVYGDKNEIIHLLFHLFDELLKYSENKEINVVVKSKLIDQGEILVRIEMRSEKSGIIPDEIDKVLKMSEFSFGPSSGGVYNSGKSWILNRRFEEGRKGKVTFVNDLINGMFCSVNLFLNIMQEEISGVNKNIIENKNIDGGL